MSYRIMFCWSSLSSYFEQSIISLNSEAFQLAVVHKQPYHDHHIMRQVTNLDNCVLHEYSKFDKIRLAEFENKFDPDLLIVGGWQDWKYRYVLKKSKALRILAMDNYYLGTMKQRIGVASSSFYLGSKFDCAFVPGLAQSEFASKLGFLPNEIFKGLYCTKPADFELQKKAIEAKTSNNNPFLFVGRLVEEKGIRTLLKGYQRYRKLSLNPRELHIYGVGKLEKVLRGNEGIKLFGFVSFDGSSEVFKNAIALVLPSVKEQFGMVALEACQHALPIILSDNVGSSRDLLREYENGFSFKTNDFSALAQAFLNFDNMKSHEYSSLALSSYEIGLKFSPEKFHESIMRMISLRKFRH